MVDGQYSKQAVSIQFLGFSLGGLTSHVSMTLSIRMFTDLAGGSGGSGGGSGGGGLGGLQ